MRTSFWLQSPNSSQTSTMVPWTTSPQQGELKVVQNPGALIKTINSSTLVHEGSWKHYHKQCPILLVFDIFLFLFSHSYRISHICFVHFSWTLSMCWVILSSTVLENHLDVISTYNLQPLGNKHPSQGRRTDGNSLLKCGDHCALVPSKAGSRWTKISEEGVVFCGCFGCEVRVL